MAYGQVVDDPNRGALQNLLAQWMQNSEQRRRDASAQAAEDQRFQQTMGLKREELDAQKGLWGAQTNKENYMVSSGRAQRIAASLKSNYDHLIAAGLPDQAAAYVRGVTKRYEKDPEIMNEVAGWVNERPLTDSDIAAQNTAFYSAQETGKAASGSPDVQARAFTQESALGRPMSGHQFADQAQRQPEAADTKTPYGQTLNIQGGRTPSAEDRLQSETQIRAANIHEAGATQRAGMQIEAGTGSGATKPAKLEEQYNNLLAKQDKIRSQHQQVRARQEAIAAAWSGLSPEARSVAQNKNREWGILERKRIDLEGMGAENVGRIQNIEKALGGRQAKQSGQREYKEYATDGKRIIGSDDGGVTWFDTATGQRVQE